MKRWLARLFYHKRIRRLEQVQRAASLLAQSRPEEAASLLERARPTAWVDDVALYHFVSGKLAMQTGDLGEAEQHLHTALGLGLERPAVKLNLAVLRLRQCRLMEAMDLLGDAMLSEDPTLVEQAKVIRSAIHDLDARPPLEELRARIDRFQTRYLGGSPQGASLAERVAALTGALRKHPKLSSKHLEDAALCYGQFLADAPGAAWVFGLEPTDHLVAAGGLLYAPYELLRQFRSGLLSELPFPGHLSELLSARVDPQ